jgi:hypothetical protein
MKNGKIVLIGFLLVILGFLTLILSIVGVKLSALVFIDYFGSFTGLIIRIGMIMTGFILAALGSTNWKENE